MEASWSESKVILIYFTYQFQATQDYIVRPHQKQKQTNKTLGAGEIAQWF